MNQSRPCPNPAGQRTQQRQLILLGLLLSLALPALAGPIQLVSRLTASQSPPAGGNGVSCLPVFSADGRFVLFASTANNLLLTSNNVPLPAPVPAWFNVFLRDRTNQSTRLVSASLTGGGGNGDSFPSALSTNGQFALFESSASDLVPGDTNSATDLFVRDLVSGAVHLVSVGTNGLPGNGASRSAAMTPDGRYIAFVSEASNLVANDTNRIPRIFLRDLQTATTVLVSVGPFSTNPAAVFPASGFDSPEITPDGRYVAFSSTATNRYILLRPGEITGGDIYVRDMLAGTNVWASSGMRANLKSVTGLTNGVCYNLALSADGRFVAYQASLLPVFPLSSLSNVNFGLILRYGLETGLTDLVHTNAKAATSGFSTEETRDLDLTPDGRFLSFAANAYGRQGTTTCIQVWDADSGTFTLASGDLSDAIPTNTLSLRPVSDATGRYVAFLSNASGLTTNTTPGAWHLYVRDTLAATTTLVDADTNGIGSPVSAATIPRLSADGRWVAFECADGNLVAHDNNHNLDVFVRDLAAGTNELISAHHPALASASPNGPSLASAFSSSTDGRSLAYASEADNLVTGDTNSFRDIFVRDLATGTNTLVSAAPGGASANSLSFEPGISGDGRWVAFTSSAKNLVAGDTNAATDVFVRDLQTGITALASVSFTGTGPGNKASFSPALSADGRWLLFRSLATDLVIGVTSGTENLFLRDLQSGATRALTVSGVTNAAMTPHGRFVAFVGRIAGSSSFYLYVWDTSVSDRMFTNSTLGLLTVAISPDGNRVAGVTATQLLIADRAAGTSGVVATLPVGSRTVPRFSADGRWLTHARALNLTNQVYLNDLQDGAEYLVSHVTNSTAGGSAHSDAPELSPDGRYVAYRTLANNVVAGANGTTRQIVLYDRLTGANSLLSASRLNGGRGDDYSTGVSFSADGQTLLLQSWASDLAPGDFNRTGDVFAYAFFTAVILPPATPGQGPWITWPFVPDNNYRVQFKNDLSDPDWQDMPGTFTTLGLKALQQDLTPNAARRFYRVVSY